VVVTADEESADRRVDEGHDPHQAERDLEGVDVGRLEHADDLADPRRRRDLPYPLLLRSQHELQSPPYLPNCGRDATLAQRLVEPAEVDVQDHAEERDADGPSQQLAGVCVVSRGPGLSAGLRIYTANRGVTDEARTRDLL
jgi:hypothetical protein